MDKYYYIVYLTPSERESRGCNKYVVRVPRNKAAAFEKAAHNLSVKGTMLCWMSLTECEAHDFCRENMLANNDFPQRISEVVVTRQGEFMVL